MEWRDEGLLIGAARHGESGLIVDVLTKERGRRRGLVRGGASSRRAAEFQIGAQLTLRWRARLETQLGVFEAEALRARAGFILDDPEALAALSAAAALIAALIPEREPQPRLYALSLALFDALAARRDWPEAYAAWELALLEELGYGLDLSACAATGGTQELIYVSPRSGRAVSRDAGAPYEDKLLRLPGFLTLEGAPATRAELAEALTLTGFFLERWAAPGLGLSALPPARARLARLLAAPR
ncbi:MAG: DNA repair protein RecO [Pseudomonadota bacterium]